MKEFTKEEGFLQALTELVKPATGCTEPVAVAYAAATCAKHLKEDEKQTVELSPAEIKEIRVNVSANVLKNAMAVIVPGTGKPGLEVAASAGALVGNADLGLKVIDEIPESALDEIESLAVSGKVKVDLAQVEDKLYVEVSIINQANHQVTVKIASGHTNIYHIQKDNKVIFEKERPSAVEPSPITDFLKEQTLQAVWDFALNVDLDKIAFIKEAKELNMRLAEAGVKEQYGLELGRTLAKADESGRASGDLDQRIVALTAAASDARMGGAALAAMTNSGSGNQGISVTVPVCLVAEEVGANDEELIRSLALAHLSALYIHAFLPILSAYCATDSAAMGAACGIVYLKTKDFDIACRAIKNMIADATGMICDGAGCACAMKVATSVSSMVRSVNLALAGITIPATNGIVSDDIDETIAALGHFVEDGMTASDPAILDIMMHKHKC